MQDKAPAPAGIEASVLIEERRGAVALLTLNRPAQRNSLSEALIAALQQAIDRLSAASDVAAVVIASQGPAFSSGHDLKEMTARRADADGGRAYFAHLMDRCAGMMLSILRSPKPFIAAVEGVASAAGCQLVATCDLAVAGAEARFTTPGVNIGLFCSTPMVALTRKVPPAVAFEMLTTGEFLDAARAREVGLVNRIADPADLDTATQALAATLAAKLTSALRIGKAAFYQQADLGLAAAYAQTGAVMVANMLDRDTDEGITAFLEKRRPDWSD